MIEDSSRMDFIPGVGDEVIVCFAIVIVLICMFGAWISTSVAEQPLIRTAVLVIERRRSSQRSVTVRPSDTQQSEPTTETPAPSNKVQTVYSDSVTEVNPDNSSVNDQPGTSYANYDNNGDCAPDSDSKASTSKYAKSSASSSELPIVDESDFTAEHSNTYAAGLPSANVIELASSASDEVVNGGPTQTDLRKRRESNRSLPPGESATNVDLNFKQVTQSTEFIRVEATKVDTEQIIGEGIAFNSENPQDNENIRIRLKFLNDTIKLVNGNLREPLGDFKRRHFGEELESNKIVRLIFNGQLLRSDQETLQFYGLFDNCVVHCQISNHVTPIVPNVAESYHDIDIGRFMLPLFGIVLGLIWYCRIQYRQFFNATSTIALVGVTGLFLISLIALCIPRRETRQITTLPSQENVRQ